MFANDQRLDDLATTTSKTVAEAITPAQAQQDTDNFMQTLRQNTNTGLITPERGLALQHQFKVGVVTNKIAQSNSTNPDDYKDLREGLDLKESNEVGKMIEAHIKQVQEQDVVNKFNNRVSTIRGIATRQIDWQSADKINQLSKTDSKLGDALQMVFDAKAQGEEYKPSTSEDAEYALSVNHLFQSKTKEEVSDYLVDALKNKNMSEGRMAVLVNAAEQRAETLPPKEDKNFVNPALVAIDAGMAGTQKWNKEHGQNDPQVLDDYMSAVKQGKSPTDAYQAAIETHQKKVNPARSQYQVGQQVFNKKTGTSGEIVGFDDNGAPLVRVKHGKPKPEQQPKQSAE